MHGFSDWLSVSERTNNPQSRATITIHHNLSYIASLELRIIGVAFNIPYRWWCCVSDRVGDLQIIESLARKHFMEMTSKLCYPLSRVYTEIYALGIVEVLYRDKNI